MKKTLAVIYNLNMPEMTDSLWDSLFPYQDDQYDLIVIDNGSKPEGKSKHTTYETGKNCYFGGALNLAMNLFLELDKYDSLLSLNNDLVLQGPNFIKTLREEMFNGDYKIISPCVLQVTNQCMWKYMHCWNSQKTRDVKWVDFQSPLLHKDFITNIKQFPNKLIYGWGQDVLSGIICEEKNWKIGVVDRCPLIHHSAKTLKEGKGDIDLTTYCRYAETAMFEYMRESNNLEIFNKFRELSATYSYK